MHESGQINTKRLMRQLEIDEGKKLKVYYDTEGLLTVGIGHLIKNTDPPEIRNLKVGDSITEDQCRELFNNDLAIAIADFIYLLRLGNHSSRSTRNYHQYVI